MSKMRLGWYAAASTGLASSVVVWAFVRRANFYSAMVYLSQSYFCKMVMTNFALLVYSSFLFALIRICFGRLRSAEVETLTERAWFAITETCLAMTIFRDESGVFFLTMFTMLVTGKIWGWICDGRIEILEQQPPANPRLFHNRLRTSLAISGLFNALIFRYTVSWVVQEARPSMMVMFLFEFAVLVLRWGRASVRYAFSVVEERIVVAQTKKRLAERRREVSEEREAIIRRRQEAAAAGGEAGEDNEPLPNPDDIEEMDIEVAGWAKKGELLLWLDLVTDFLKLVIYFAFFFMLLIFYGLPIHIVRDVFLTIRDFLKRFTALVRYRKAIKELNQYPDATAEDLDRDNTCIICREEMRPWDVAQEHSALDRIRAKKLPCSHALHLGCLKSWLERQQVCPTCRAPVTSAQSRNAGNAAAVRIELGGRPQPQGQQNGPAGNGQNGNAPNEQPRNGGARILNLGPIRLGFGANEQQVRELAQQMRVPANMGLNADQQGQGTNANQGAPATRSSSVDDIQNARSLIQQASQHITSEYMSLISSSQDLVVIQGALNELQRLQRLHQHGQQGDQSSLSGRQHSSLPPPYPLHNLNVQAVAPGGIGTMPPMAGTPFSPHPPVVFQTPMTRLGVSGSGNAITSGSADLPEGVVIPPGWSLMPLQRLDQNAQVQPAPSPTVARDSSQHSVGQAAAPPAQSPQPSTPTGAASSTTQLGNAAPSIPNILGRFASASTEAAGSPAPGMAQEPSAVVSPSPVTPSWGGSAQMFGSGPRSTDGGAEGADAGQQSGADKAEAEESQSSSSNSADEADVGKGKSKAVTVEDADDEQHD